MRSSSQCRTVRCWRSGVLAAVCLASCSSPPPPRLYLLNATAPPTASRQAVQIAAQGGSGSSQPAGRTDAGPAPVLGVAVTVPAYLDRREIMLRSGPNEVKALEDGKWADDLPVVATRAMTDDLGALLPSRRVVALPARQPVDGELRVEFSSFDIRTDGSTLLAGRWTLAEDGKERGGGSILRGGNVAEPGFDATAASLSRDLAAISSDIAGAIARLGAPVSR